MGVRVAAVALHRPQRVPINLVLSVLVPDPIPLPPLLPLLLLEPEKLNFFWPEDNRFIFALPVKSSQKAFN